MRRWLVSSAVVLLAVVAVLLWARSDDATDRAEDLTHDSVAEGAPPAHPGLAVDARLQGRVDAAHADAADASARTPVRLQVLGEVVDAETGDSLAGVRVRLGRVAPMPHASAPGGVGPESCVVTEGVGEFAGERLTGSDGRFTFGVADVRAWSIRATKEGYAAAVAGGMDWDPVIEESVATMYIALGRAHAVRLQVVDPADRPIGGATVSQYSGELDRPPVAVVRTDEDGWFELVCSKDDVLIVRAAGFAWRQVGDVVGRDGAPIVLTAPFAVGGTVVDEADAPIAGAVVWAESEPFPVRVTDAEGRFVWDDLPQSDRHILLLAEAAGRLPGCAYVTPGQTDVRIPLAQPGVLAGRFVFPAGAAAQPVSLRVDGPANFRHLEDLPTSAFHVAGLPPGVLRVRGEVPRTVRALGRDYAVPALRGEVEIPRLPGADLHGVEVRLEPVVVSYVVVRIVDPDGRPIYRAGHDVDAPYGGASSRRTNEDGLIWSARGVVPGTLTQVRGWRIVAVHNGTTVVHGEYVPVRTSAQPDAEPVDVELHSDPGRVPTKARLTLFTERADGAPLPAGVALNWHVSVRGSPYGSNPEMRGPQPGGVRWRGDLVVNAGVELEVIAWADGCANRHYRLPALRAGESRELVCRLHPESLVRGRLVTRAGRPVGFHAVQVEVRPPDGHPVASGLGAYNVGVDGRFTVPRLCAGPARLSVTREDGTIVFETTIEVLEAAILEVGDVVLGSLQTLDGIVRDARGGPLGGVRVEAFELGMRQPYARSSTHADGRFVLRAPLRAASLLRLTRRDFAPLYLTLAPGHYEALLELTLQRPGTLIVECGLPPANLTTWWLGATELTCGHALQSLGRGTRAGDGHRWTLRGLPIGRVRLELCGRQADGSPWRSEKQAPVVSGETTTVRFDGEE